MPKKTTLLIIALAVVTGALLFLAIVSTQSPGLKTNIPPKQQVEKTAKVSFSPQTIEFSGSSVSVDIVVDTGGSDITGVQAEMLYDPKALTNIRVLPTLEEGSFFGPRAVVLFNEVNAETGRISFVIAINTGDEPKKGVGKIATLTFQKAVNAPSSTQINFLDKTLVTRLGIEESVLKEAAPLTVSIPAGEVRTTPQVTRSPQVTSAVTP
jgi:hypothetical protein